MKNNFNQKKNTDYIDRHYCHCSYSNSRMHVSLKALEHLFYIVHARKRDFDPKLSTRVKKRRRRTVVLRVEKADGLSSWPMGRHVIANASNASFICIVSKQ